MIRYLAFVLLALALFGCGGAGKRSEPLTVFYAGSLEGALERWSEMFRRREGIEVRISVCFDCRWA